MSSIENKGENRPFWKSLKLLKGDPEHLERLKPEFTDPATEKMDPISRRNFLSLMGASMALAGTAGCRRPVEKIVPYHTHPEEVLLGQPLQFATTMPFGVDAYGVLVTSNEGRPTKIEGNELHSASAGKANNFMLASILDLYDPDRTRRVFENGQNKTLDEFVEAWKKWAPDYEISKGEGLAFLLEPSSSPTMAALKNEIEKRFPKASWAVYEPVSDENILDGHKAATTISYSVENRFDKAAVVLSLDADFLHMESNSLVSARQFMDGRRINDPDEKMNRLYCVESGFSLTGAVSDHRLKLQSGQVGGFLAAIALELGRQDFSLKIAGAAVLPKYSSNEFDQNWIKSVAKDLLAHKGKGIIIAGRRQPAEVHALVMSLNKALGNTGSSVFYRKLKDTNVSSKKDLVELTGKMKKGGISTLFILGGNPVYNAPADLNFADALTNVKTSIHLSSHHDETSKLTKWQLPRLHYLETWGDARSRDGSLSVIQPLIAPLYQGFSELDLLGIVARDDRVKSYDLVRETWKSYIKGDFEGEWRKVLHDGILVNSQEKPADVIVSDKQTYTYLRDHPFNVKADKLEVVFQADQSAYDGRFSNNGWLQELPDPVTKIVWDNAAVMSPKTGDVFGVKTNDLVKISLDGAEVELPVFLLPGHADNSISLPLGYGRKEVGRVADISGFNVYPVRTVKSFDQAYGASISATGNTYTLASTQEHGYMEGRPLVREATRAEYQADPEFASHMQHVPELKSLWNEHTYEEGYQWGMAIDLNSCIGCNACALACQSENNIPIVGKKEAGYGREMHWIRMDRYFIGDQEDPTISFQPVGCQHCEMAPCEQVCPVAATVHDQEGLNLMVYNRCIGTRYCSNNCPYKARRFNFYNFTNTLPELIKMAQNPDVTVRSRGVMEKCTYCLQRINRAKRTAKMEGREVRDGEVVTACQQACPTDAISFGNLMDKKSKVVADKQSNRNYEILAEFNTRPRTSYMAKLRNPNPELG